MPIFTNVQQGPSCQCAKFHPILLACVGGICCQTSSILWQHDRQTKKKQ